MAQQGVYDPDDTNLVVGVGIVTGFAEKSVIKLEDATKDRRKWWSGLKGEAGFSVSKDKRKKVTIVLNPDSPWNVYFDAIDKAGALIPVGLQQKSGGAYAGGGSRGQILNRPDHEISNEATNKTWVIGVLDWNGAYLPESA